jgi:hypothetical protein
MLQDASGEPGEEKEMGGNQWWQFARLAANHQTASCRPSAESLLHPAASVTRKGALA